MLWIKIYVRVVMKDFFFLLIKQIVLVIQMVFNIVGNIYLIKNVQNVKHLILLILINNVV